MIPIFRLAKQMRPNHFLMYGFSFVFLCDGLSILFSHMANHGFRFFQYSFPVLYCASNHTLPRPHVG
jgi:hypothetical protein